MPKRKGEEVVYPRFAMVTKAKEGLMEFTRQDYGDEEPYVVESWNLDRMFEAYPPNITSAIVRYGLSGLLQDRTSDFSQEESRPAEIAKVDRRLREGLWEKEREGGVGQPSGLLIQALQEARKAATGETVSASDIIGSWSGMSKEAREAVKAAFAARVEELRRSAKTVDLSSFIPVK
jgi:hypothetical protein